MSKSNHTEAQIIAALKQVEAGRTVDDVARECGVVPKYNSVCLICRRGQDSVFDQDTAGTEIGAWLV